MDFMSEMKRGLQWNTLILSTGLTSCGNLHCSVICPLKLLGTPTLWSSNLASPDSFRQPSAVQLAALPAVGRRGSRAFEFRECSRRIVNAVEKLRRADDLSQEMPVQVCLQRERRASEYQHNSAVDQFLVKLTYHPGRRVIHIRDRFRIDGQPAHG